jgi:hypothetical protein
MAQLNNLKTAFNCLTSTEQAEFYDFVTLIMDQSEIENIIYQIENKKISFTEKNDTTNILPDI